jgi:DNA polymerase III epsilon subunit-like protein
MNLFPIDVETTGLDPKKHEIIELAFSIIINGVKHCSMELYMRPERWDMISSEALAVNGWTLERLKRLPEMEYSFLILTDIMGRHLRHFGKFRIVEYGNGFDSRFVAAFLNSIGIDCNMYCFFQKQSTNVHSIAKKKLPGLKSYKLKDVARRLGIPVDERQLHGAAYDRDLMIEVYMRLGGGF